MFRNLIILLGSLIITLPISAKAPVKYGKVTLEELQMTSYENDTSAAAIVLCEYGYFNAASFNFTNTLRLKILKPAGLDWGDFYTSTMNEVSIKGITFNLENGEIVESKLKSESVYKVKITNNLHQTRIAMPAVKVGSVIDIEWSYVGIPLTWRFQKTIPVKHSELVMEQSPYLTFSKNFFGFEPLTLNENGHWLAQNMPAFKFEPYMNSYENYLTKFEFDLSVFSVPGYAYEAFTTSWEAVNKRLLDESQFGGALNGGSLFLVETAKTIKEKYTTNQDKIRAAVEAVKRVKWNENRTGVYYLRKFRIQFQKPHRQLC